MSMRCVEISVSTNASGAGGGTSSYPLRGEIVEVRVPQGGTAITLNGGTTDWTLTRQRDGGTVATISNTDAPFQAPIRAKAVSTAGGTAYTGGDDLSGTPDGGVPIDDYLIVTIADGQFSKAGTVFVHVKG